MEEETYPDIPDHGSSGIFDELDTDLLDSAAGTGATEDLDDAGISGLMCFDLNCQARCVRENIAGKGWIWSGDKGGGYCL